MPTILGGRPLTCKLSSYPAYRQNDSMTKWQNEWSHYPASLGTVTKQHCCLNILYLNCECDWLFSSSPTNPPQSPSSLHIRGTPDPDPAGYPVNFVDPVRIRMDPETVDPVEIRIRSDPECRDPAGIRIRPDPKSPDPDPAGSYLNTTNTEWLNVVS